jgi:hypothetical protein
MNSFPKNHLGLQYVSLALLNATHEKGLKFCWNRFQ